jgi:CRP-like cAMP-binding protein
MLDMSFLSGIDLFKDLPNSCLEVLKKDSHILDCSAGYLFYASEQTSRVLFVLQKGSVCIFQTYGDKRLTIATLQPPPHFRRNGLLWPREAPLPRNCPPGPPAFA